MVEASLSITEEELRTLRDNESLEMEVHKSPLRDLMFSLVNMLETDSEESQTLEKEKGSRAPAVIYHSIPTTFPTQQTSLSQQQSSPLSSHPRLPHSYNMPDNKRKISETSFGTRSTETTPTKLVHPEAKVQSLQNKFVDTIINKLWLGKIDVSWAKGRRMFLSYSEFPSFKP